MAKVEKYRSLPNGFSTLLNKMLRAVLISRPLETVEFFADYLEAEINRRTLCDLQLKQPCPSGVLQPSDPWVQYMSFLTIQRAIEALVQEEHPTAPFQWDDQRRLTVQTGKCGAASVRRRMTHKPFQWPPVVKDTHRCRRRFDRYGPIVETISITSRSIRRYMTDEGAGVAADKCQGRRPIANFWRQILRDCSVKADQWNRKTEHPRRRLRSSTLTAEAKSSGGAEGEEADEDEGSDTSIDPYLEPKRRRKARNDEGLAKIIYRELRSGLPPLPEAKPPSEIEDKLPPGKASKAVQVELVPSRIPGHPPPPETDEAIPVQVLHKAVQVGVDEMLAEDTTAFYSPPDVPAAALDVGVQVTCPPAPMPVPLAIDWTPFLRPTAPWPDSAIDWLTMIYQDEEDDGEDLPALQPEPSPAAETLAEESQFLQFGDLDFPAVTTVADTPALPLLLAETDVPAICDLADIPAEPLDHENDYPAVTAGADFPAEPMMPAKESAAQLMNIDEVDDPFSDGGPPVPLKTSDDQGPVPLVISEDQEPAPLVTSEDQEPAPLATSEDRGPMQLVTSKDQGPVPLMTSEDQGPVPLVTSEDQGPAPLVTSEDQGPAPSVTSEDQGPVPLMTSDDQEPAPLVTSEDQEPAPLVTSEDQEPAPLATSEDQGPVPLVTSNDQGPVPLITSEDQGPVPLVTSEDQGPVPLVTSNDQGPVPLMTSEDQEPVPLVTSEDQGPAPLVTSEDQGPVLLVTSEDQGPVPLVTSEDQGPVPLVTSEDQGPVPLEASEDQGPVPLEATKGHGSSTLLPEIEELRA